MATLNLSIENMHCGACVRRVMQALNAVPGTHAEEVRIGNARVNTTGGDDAVLAALQSAGFPARVETDGK